MPEAVRQEICIRESCRRTEIIWVAVTYQIGGAWSINDLDIKLRIEEFKSCLKKT